MLNPSMLQNIPTASTLPSSSSTHPAAGNGAGAQTSDAPSFSKALASEMHGKQHERTAGAPAAAKPDAARDADSSTLPRKLAADTVMESMAPGAEPADAVPDAGPARHAARTGPAAGATAEDTEGVAGREEKDNSDSLAEMLAGLGMTQFPHVPGHIPVETRTADARTGVRDSGLSDSGPLAAKETSKEGTVRTDIFQWVGGRDANSGKPGIATSGASLAAAAPVAQAKGKQGVLPDTGENAARTDKADKADRVEAGRPDAPWRIDLKSSLPDPGVAGESEKRGKAVTDAQSPSLLQSTPTAPQMSFMTQPAERQFTMASTGAGAPVSVMQDLQTPVGDSGWDDALGQKVMWMVSSQEQVAEISLNPPDLGPLQVTLSISNDQATATFVSQHADVRQALEAALPRLKEMMAESGIDLGGATVSSGSEGSQQQGFDRQNRPGSRYSSGEGAIGPVHDSGVKIGSHGGKNRLVDIFA